MGLLLRTGGGFYLAYKHAMRSNVRSKMAAVLVRGGSVLSVGYNRKAFHTKAYYGQSIHAECDAINKNKTELVGQAKLFVYRFSNEFIKEELRVSRPCVRCQQEIKKAQISRVVYLDHSLILQSEKFKTVPEIARPDMLHLACCGNAGIY